MHVYEPGALLHVASAWHWCEPIAHSSLSTQLSPSPEYPAGQEHANPSSVSMHVDAKTHRLRVAFAHSFSGTQPPPLTW